MMSKIHNAGSTSCPKQSQLLSGSFCMPQCVNSEANDESYDELRKAVAENWVTMKFYYKASMDAFMKKEFESAQNLLEQGNFYKTKAREADEKSAQKLIENSNKEEEYCINVHYLEPKDALYHMKLHLSSLCAIQFMKVVVGTGGDKKDKRRKLLITNLLEEEGITWTEEGNGWTISIRVDQIDHNKLSFINK
ncbi:hypothetical protein SASPL_157885 [Salvia splendens]|nr:hypothetical protein SASPL_157885 [Salvia splendens]